MKAEIIAFGSELTNGEKLDTNSQWLSQQLAALGITVHCHVTLPDDHDEIVKQLELSSSRSELIISTGGLGPTQDDLTRDVVASLCRVELIEHPASLAHVEGLFQKAGRDMPASNRRQAQFPSGAEPLANPIGTAPGFWQDLGHCQIIALPGVPSEMKAMFEASVKPRLSGDNQVVRFTQIHSFGLGESKTEELLGDLTSRGRNPEVGITSHEATITLRLKAVADSADECQQQILSTENLIRVCLGDHIYGKDTDTLATVVLNLLNHHEHTLATAEYGTGASLSHSLNPIGHGSSSYLGGIVASTTPQPSLMDQAHFVKDQHNATFGLAVRVDFPADEIVVALTTLNDDFILTIPLYGNPQISQSRAAKCALDLLRRHLLSLPTQSS